MNFAKSSKPSPDASFQGQASLRTSRGTSQKRSRCGLSSKSTGYVDLRGITEALRWVPNSVWIILVSLIAAVIFIQCFRSAMDLPTVYTSYLTKKCEKVVNADGSAGDCAHLPDRYHNVWSY